MKTSLGVPITFIVIAGILVCLVLGAFRTIRPVPATAQNEIRILRKAEKKIEQLFELSDEQSQNIARSLSILAIAEQLKRIADTLERR